MFFDWAGTITIPMGPLLMEAAERLGLSAADMGRAFSGFADYVSGSDSPIHLAELGRIEDEELWDQMEEAAPGAGGLLNPSGPSIFTGSDRPEMLALLEDLADAGVFVLLATNNFVSAHDVLARRYLETGLVNGIANSALMGVRKPDPVFFEFCLEAAGVEPAAALFLDDQQANVDAAEGLGITSLLVGSDAAPVVAAVRVAVGLS